MEFKGPYLMAMRDQAPKMFRELRRTGALDAHVQKKAVEAQRLFEEIAGPNPTLPKRREAEDLVRGTLIEFPDDAMNEVLKPGP